MFVLQWTFIYAHENLNFIPFPRVMTIAFLLIFFFPTKNYSQLQNGTVIVGRPSGFPFVALARLWD